MNKGPGLLFIIVCLLATGCSKKVITPVTTAVPKTAMNIEEIDFDLPCDLVGITGYIIQIQRVFEIAERLRERERGEVRLDRVLELLLATNRHRRGRAPA